MVDGEQVELQRNVDMLHLRSENVTLKIKENGMKYREEMEWTIHMGKRERRKENKIFDAPKGMKKSEEKKRDFKKEKVKKEILSRTES